MTIHLLSFARRRGPGARALLVLAALLLGARPGQAQVDTYTFAPGTGTGTGTGTFTPLPAAAINVPTVQADDALSGTLPLGFTFVFDGTPHTTCAVSSNGWLTFNPNAIGNSLTNNLATGTATERPRVAPFWDDLDGGTGGTASYLTTGTAPNRVFTFEWLNWYRYGNGPGPSFSMQVQLVEGTNVVRFAYRQEMNPLGSASASIGLSGVGTGPGSFLSLSNASAAPGVSSATETSTIGALPATNQLYVFTPPAPTLCPTPRNLTATALTATSATLGFTVTNATPGPFTIQYGPTGFNPALPSSGTNTYTTITSTGTSAPIAGLTANTGYQFYVTQNCGGTNGNSARSNAGAFTTNPNPAVNDNCAQAGALAVSASCATPVSGTVFGATQSLAPTAGCGFGVSTANDVWYSFTATATAHQLTTGAAFGGLYDVRSGTCAASTSIFCGAMGTTATSQQSLLSGLTVGQTYFVRVYATAATPPPVGSSTFTLCLTPVLNYCNTGLGGFCGGNDITAVSIAGTTLNAAGLTCANTGSQAYTTYPATGVTTATLQSGVPYQLSVTMQAGSIASVWIDYNRNLALEPSEFTQITTSSVGTGPTAVTINIPTNAVQGLTTMRVRTRGAFSTNGPTDACTNFGSGETKDFSLTIGPPAACPTASGVSVSSITTTSAVLTYTTNAAATTYTLTLTPQGGTATTSTVTSSPVTLTPLQPNTPYTVSLVSNCAGSLTSPPVVLTFTTNPLPATNNECTTATTLPVTATCASPTTGTVLGATQSLPPTANCGFGITAANDVWYSFVATSAAHTIALNAQFNAAYDVRSGACASTTSVFCTTANTGFPASNTVGGLTVGQTYFVRVYAQGAQPTGPASTFTLCVTPGPATPANDECAGALTVPVQFGTCVGQTSADNTSATTSTGVPAPSCGFNVQKDIWFKVTVPASGAVTVQTVAPTGGSNITDTVINMYSGTCAALTEVGCNDDTNGLYSQIALTGRTPGEVLYIRAWAYSSANTGLIAVCATAPSNCAAPTGPTVGTVTNTTAQLSWVAPAGSAPGNTYEVEVGLQGAPQGSGTTTTGLTGVTFLATGLSPNSNYCFYVRQNCGSVNGSSTFIGPTCFTTPLTAPANNEPCGAATVGVGATVSGSNVGATPSFQPGIVTPACSPSAAPKDVWFAFTPSAATSALTVTGAAAGMVRVFTAPNCATGPFTQVFCQSGGAPNTNVGPINLAGLTVGQRYYVAISGWGSSDPTGAFTIRATNLLATKTQANADALLVYPNPSSTGQLTVRLTGLSGPATATLLNALGQAVRTQALRGGAPEHTLPTRGLATGIYTLRVAVADQVLTRKVVLE